MLAKASTKTDFPAPDSPVMTLRPGCKLYQLILDQREVPDAQVSDKGPGCNWRVRVSRPRVVCGRVCRRNAGRLSSPCQLGCLPGICRCCC